MLGEEALVILVSLIWLMAAKMDKPILHVNGWIKNHIATAVARSYSWIIGGDCLPVPWGTKIRTGTQDRALAWRNKSRARIILGAYLHEIFRQYSRVLNDTDNKVQAFGFKRYLGKTIILSVVHDAIAYECGYTVNTKIMAIHYDFYLESISVDLIPPFMMYLSGLQLYECHKLLAKETPE